MARDNFLPKEPIKIEGLIQFQTALKAIETGAQKELKDVLNKGAKIVADDAQRRANRDSSRAANSIKAASQQRAAIVKGGGTNRAVMYGFLDFGGSVGRGHQRGPNMGAIKRPFKVKGRYIYPAFDANRDEIHDVLNDGFIDLMSKHGLEPD